MFVFFKWIGNSQPGDLSGAKVSGLCHEVHRNGRLERSKLFVMHFDMAAKVTYFELEEVASPLTSPLGHDMGSPFIFQ